jgi:prefoldin subunit 5
MDKTLYEFDRKLKSAKTALHRKGDIIKNLSREVSELKELLRMSEENNQRWKHLFQLSREGQVSLDVADAEQDTRGHVPGEPQAPRTENLLAELELLRDRLSHLEGEVEALQGHA